MTMDVFMPLVFITIGLWLLVETYHTKILDKKLLQNVMFGIGIFLLCYGSSELVRASYKKELPKLKQEIRKEISIEILKGTFKNEYQMQIDSTSITDTVFTKVK